MRSNKEIWVVIFIKHVLHLTHWIYNCLWHNVMDINVFDIFVFDINILGHFCVRHYCLGHYCLGHYCLGHYCLGHYCLRTFLSWTFLSDIIYCLSSFFLSSSVEVESELELLLWLSAAIFLYATSNNYKQDWNYFFYMNSSFCSDSFTFPMDLLKDYSKKSTHFKGNDIVCRSDKYTTKGEMIDWEENIPFNQWINHSMNEWIINEWVRNEWVELINYE